MSWGSAQTDKRTTAEKWAVAERRWFGKSAGERMIFIQLSRRGFEMGFAARHTVGAACQLGAGVFC